MHVQNSVTQNLTDLLWVKNIWLKYEVLVYHNWYIQHTAWFLGVHIIVNILSTEKKGTREILIIQALVEVIQAKIESWCKEVVHKLHNTWTWYVHSCKNCYNKVICIKKESSILVPVCVLKGRCLIVNPKKEIWWKSIQ